MVCPICKSANDSNAKFCIECGQRLISTIESAERRQVTAMFCDLVGSTALSEQLDPEEYANLLGQYQKICSTNISRYRGEVHQYLGDGVLSFFGFPNAYEDDPRRAINSGLGIIEEIRVLTSKTNNNLPLSIRIGIHTGIVVAGELTGKKQVLGKTPNLAARLQEIAEPNTVVISAATWKLVRGFYKVRSIGGKKLKGLEEIMQVYKVVETTSAQHRLDTIPKHELTPFVGREDEIKFILDKWHAATACMGSAILIEGEAGIGKSRLMDQVKRLIAKKAKTNIKEFRCSSYHEDSAYYPIIQWLRNNLLLFNDEPSIESKRKRILVELQEHGLMEKSNVMILHDLLSLPLPNNFKGPQLSPAKLRQLTFELLFEILLNQLSQATLLIIFEDLHWADPSTKDWLQALMPKLNGQRICVMITTRPSKKKIKWLKEGSVCDLTLQPLNKASIETICSYKSGGMDLPEEIIALIENKTDGNPLYIEEYTSNIIESGVVQEEQGQYSLIQPIDSLKIPSTLQDSLMSRLDRLSEAKEVAQMGAIFGRTFSTQQLLVVSGFDDDKLQRELSELSSHQLILAHGEEEYIFKHALVQDAAYTSLLRSRRSELHKKAVLALQKVNPHIEEQEPELLAHHYSEAGQYEMSLPLWLKAGQTAAHRNANDEAITHLVKGINQLKQFENNNQKQLLALNLYMTLGGAYVVRLGYTHPKVASTFKEARKIAMSIGAFDQLAYIYYGLSTYYLLKEDHDSCLKYARQSVKLGKKKNQYLLQLFGYHMLGASSVMKGNFPDGNELLQKTLDIYDPAISYSLELTPGGDVRINASVWLMISLHKSGYPDQAKKISEQVAEWSKNIEEPRTLYHAHGWDAWLRLITREWVDSAKYMERYIPIASEFGDPWFLLTAKGWYNFAKAFQGDDEAFQLAIELLETGIKMGAMVSYGQYDFVSELLHRFGKYKLGLQKVNEAISHYDSLGGHMNLAELFRIKADILCDLGRSREKVEENYFKSIDIARKQSAKFSELRTVRHLAEYWHQNGENLRAHNLLFETYSWFEEGLDSPDLIEAKELLGKLAEDH